MARVTGAHTYINKQTFNRFHTTGTALVAGDFALSAGWGTGAAVSAISGNDGHAEFTVTAGTGPAANPTITLTFKDGTWTTAPFAVSKLTASTDVLTAPITETTSATTLVITYNGTPVNGATYTFRFLAIGA